MPHPTTAHLTVHRNDSYERFLIYNSDGCGQNYLSKVRERLLEETNFVKVTHFFVSTDLMICVLTFLTEIKLHFVKKLKDFRYLT